MERLNQHQHHYQQRHHHHTHRHNDNIEKNGRPHRTQDNYLDGDQPQTQKPRVPPRRLSEVHIPERQHSANTRFTSLASPKSHRQSLKSPSSPHPVTSKGLSTNVRPMSPSSLTPRSYSQRTPRKSPFSPRFSYLKNEVDFEYQDEERMSIVTGKGDHNPSFESGREKPFFLDNEDTWVDPECHISKQLTRTCSGNELKKSVSSCTVDGLGFDLETIDLTNDTDRCRVSHKNTRGSHKSSHSKSNKTRYEDDEDAYEIPRPIGSESGSSEDNGSSQSPRRYISVESLVLEDNFNASHTPKKTSPGMSESSDSCRMTEVEELPQVKVVWTTPPQTRSKKKKEVPAVKGTFSSPTTSVPGQPPHAANENILNFFTRTEGVEKEGRFQDVQPIINKFFSVSEDNGVSIKCINLKQVLDNMGDFVLQPAAIGFDVQCRVTRDRKGVDRGLYPTYYMHLERPDGRKILLLTGRKRKKSTTSNYLISTDAADLSRNSNHFVGKVRSNLLGTQFTIYDNVSHVVMSDYNGQSMKRFGLFQTYDSSTPAVREELAAVIYEPNVLGFKGPRKMKVLIPEMKNEARRREHRPDSEKDNVLELFKQGDAHEFFELKNKAPIWNDDNQSFVLNFHGRVTQASVKNFQIIHEKMDDYVVLQFGRVASDLFTMDYRYPLCALQAFAIVLTSFDNKLACE